MGILYLANKRFSKKHNHDGFFLDGRAQGEVRSLRSKTLATGYEHELKPIISEECNSYLY
jgi:hypothetical protein